MRKKKDNYVVMMHCELCGHIQSKTLGICEKCGMDMGLYGKPIKVANRGEAPKPPTPGPHPPIPPKPPVPGKLRKVLGILCAVMALLIGGRKRRKDEEDT